MYIARQIEQSENYKKFLELVYKKHIKVYEAVSGKRIYIENNLYFDIIWPTNKQITTNAINNNAIVCNLHYKNFSMLFTGDIEEIAEKEVLNLYKNNEKLLKADVLKVGHHRLKNIEYQILFKYC